jgi:hypothetical protein
MEKTNKILLNSQRLPNNVNVNTQIQLGMENTNKPLPLNDIDTTISQYEQFEKERKEINMNNLKRREKKVLFIGFMGM